MADFLCGFVIKCIGKDAIELGSLCKSPVLCHLLHNLDQHGFKLPGKMVYHGFNDELFLARQQCRANYRCALYGFYGVLAARRRQALALHWRFSRWLELSPL